MWATFPMLREALDVIEAWGFSYKTVAFNWVKQNRNGTGIFMGLGNWTRSNSEICLPESEFLLRVDPDEGIGFFEADGGIWKLEAKKNIADYFLKNMGDLIDAGKVVVMQ